MIWLKKKRERERGTKLKGRVNGYIMWFGWGVKGRKVFLMK